MSSTTTTTTTTKLLRPKAAAARLGLSESTLAKWRLTGAQALPYLKVGSRVYYDSAVIDAWLARQVRRSTSDRSPAVA